MSRESGLAPEEVGEDDNDELARWLKAPKKSYGCGLEDMGMEEGMDDMGSLLNSS